MELRSEQNSSSAIRVEHLHYSYPAAEGQTEHVVFDDLDLTIEQGSFVAVLGHNGCGKSTLAKHFNAILLPQGGSVHVWGTQSSVSSVAITQR